MDPHNHLPKPPRFPWLPLIGIGALSVTTVIRNKRTRDAADRAVAAGPAADPADIRRVNRRLGVPTAVFGWLTLYSLTDWVDYFHRPPAGISPGAALSALCLLTGVTGHVTYRCLAALVRFNVAMDRKEGLTRVVALSFFVASLAVPWVTFAAIYAMCRGTSCGGGAFAALMAFYSLLAVLCVVRSVTRKLGLYKKHSDRAVSPEVLMVSPLERLNDLSFLRYSSRPLHGPPGSRRVSA